MRKFDVTKFGESAAEQVENMNFTNAERQILDYAKKVDECEFSDEQYYELAYYFAQHNGLNENGFTDEHEDLMDEYNNVCNDEDDEDDVEAVVDANGYIIKKGCKVIWADPETGNKVKYEVYEEPSEEMVKLANEYGECEAFPWECRVIEI